MNRKINWGIIGLGKIAHVFATDLIQSKESTLFGVASRNPDKAQAFAEKFQAIKYFNNYQDLANNPNIDVVYIATPHVFHFELTMMCLKAGKHVLCEKAFGMNEKEVKAMTEEAKRRNLFLMEAMWTRFIPATETVLDLINKGVIGQVKQIRADFGFMGNMNPDVRLHNKKLGGGSLLDIGIYPVFISLLLLGEPRSITATAAFTSSGVDSFLAAILDFENGEKAVLESTFEVQTATEAYIFGEKGSLKLHSRFHHSKKIDVDIYGAKTNTIDINYLGNGYLHEIMEVENCIKRGETESSKMPHSMSLSLIRTLDLIRKEIGLDYHI